jgi:hypothetical protein
MATKAERAQQAYAEGYRDGLAEARGQEVDRAARQIDDFVTWAEGEQGFESPFGRECRLRKRGRRDGRRQQ